MLFLRQSTASQEILLGPFVDDTDGKTAETGLTIANTDIKLWVEGATSEASKTSGGATHIASGRYYAVLDATDTANIGKLEINVHVAGALPVRREYMVLHANVYDSIVGSVALSGLDAAGIRSAVGLGSANLDTQLTAIDDFLDTEVAAIKAKTDNLPSDPADASDIAGVLTTLGGKIDTIDDFLDTEIAAIKAKTDGLPSDPADASDIAASFSTVNSTLSTIAGYIDTEIAAIKAKTDNLPSDPADASDIATAFSGVNTKLDTIDDFLDTEVAAIKAKTDNLPSDPADASVIAGRFDTLDASIATVDTNVDAILVDTGTTIPDLIDGIDTGGGGGGGSVEIVTEKVAVGEHYVETGGSLAAFRFNTYQLVEGVRVLHTYDDMTIALYIDGTLSGTVPVATELSEGKFQFAASPVLPTITAGQRLRIAASSDDGDIDDEDVWFGIVAAESSLAQVVFTSFEDANTGGANVTWYTNETAKTKTVQCVNANGDPIDLDTDYDLTDAYLVIERAGPSRADVQTIPIGEITIGGADDNELTFQADEDVLRSKGDFIWAFRQADKSVIATGRITVSYAADITP